MNKSALWKEVTMTGRPTVRSITLLVTLLFYLILGHTAMSFSDNAAKGVHVVEFKTNAGLVKVFLPDDVSAGDTVSASIALSPGGVTGEVMNRNLGILNTYIIETSFFKVPASQKTVKMNVPRNSAGTEMRFTLRDASMRPLASASVPIGFSSSARRDQETATPYDYQCPLVGQAGRTVEIKGPFDGDFATTDFRIGNKKANVIAESPRKLVFESPSDVIGSVEVVLVEQDVEVRRPFTCLQVLKIGEGDAVPVGSGTRSASPVGTPSEERAKPLTEPRIGERELPPATTSLEFRSIRAEENMPPPKPAAEAPLQAPIPGGRNEEVRLILASQMESAASLDSRISASAAKAEPQALEEKSAPSLRTDEYLEEALIETAPENAPEIDSQSRTPPLSNDESAPATAASESTAAVLEGQLLASFTGGTADGGGSDALSDADVKSPAVPESPGKFTLQVASYRHKQDAEAMAGRLTREGYQAFVAEADIPGKGKWYRVRVGRFGTREEAASFGEGLKRKERFIKSVYVAEDD